MKIPTHNQVIRGYVAPRPTKAPANLDEVVSLAVMEHLKFHTNDGLLLFVWATPSITGTTPHIYPISATGADMALQIAQGLHEQRGLPVGGDWRLLFPKGAHEQSSLVIQ